MMKRRSRTNKERSKPSGVDTRGRIASGSVGSLSGVLSRRTFIRGAAVLGLTGSSALAAAFSSAGTSSAASAQLVIAAPHTPKSVDFNGLSDAVEFEAVLNLYDTLVDWKLKPGANGVTVADLSGVRPSLAENWGVSSDGRTTTFHLRRGVKSYFGNELTANDVKFTYESGFAAKGVALFGDTICNISNPDQVKIIDSHTVQVTLGKPSSIYLPTLTNPTIGAIIDSTEAKKHATASDPYALTWQRSHDQGFGPYHLSELTPDQQAVYTANPNYWRGKPYFDRVVVKVIPESAQRFQLLQGGAVDVAAELAPQEYKTLMAQQGKDTKVISVPGIFNFSLRLNPTIKPFDNPKLREAIAYAVPYKAILNDVFLGQAKQMRSYVPEQATGYAPNFWTIDTDEARAKSLLADAGLPNGLKVDFYYSQAVPAEEQIAVITRSGLAKVGIDMTLNKVTAAQYTTGLFGKKFGFFIDTDAPFVADVGYASWLWFNPKSPIDYVNYNDPAVTQLIDSALGDLNPTSRNVTYHKIQEAIAKALVWIYLAVPNVLVATKKDIVGYTWRPISQPRWNELSRSS